MSTLGDRIRKARENKGLLQSELAKLIGVKSGAVISNWEKDINKPDAEKIVRLCQTLGVSASYILDYAGDGNQCPLLSRCEESGARRVAEMYMELDEYDRGRAVGTMETLLDDEKYKKDGSHGTIAG